MSAADTPQVSRGLLIALVAVVGLGAVWLFVVNPLLLEEPTEDPGPTPPVAAPPEGVAGDDEATQEELLEELPIETYEIFLARDPFSPVVPPAPAGDGTADGAPGGGTDTDGDGIPDDTNGDGIPDDGDGDGVPDDGGQLPPTNGEPDEHGIVSVRIETTAGACDPVEPPCAFVLFEGEDRVWLVREGDLFGPDLAFFAVDIEDPCITIRTGDETFVRCEPAPADGTEDPCTGGDSEAVCDGQVVSVVDVFFEDGQARAVVEVDGRLFDVAVGDVFADNYRVLDIDPGSDPPCVTLQFGDDTFELCEGQGVLK